MKKILSILLLALFAISLYFSLNNEIASTATNSNETSSYASIIPIPPPDPGGRRGC